MKKYLHIAYLLILMLVGICSLSAHAFQSSGTYRGSDAFMLATIIYHEIGGYSEADMQQVANVVMNQYNIFRNGKGGENVQIGDILTKKWNFSFSEKYLTRNMTDAEIYAKIPKDAASQRVWEQSMKIAKLAISGQLADITQGATHYRTCNRKTGAHTTFWGASALNLSHNGPHCFFKNIKMGALRINGKTIALEGKLTGNNGGTYVGSTEGGGSGGGWGDLGVGMAAYDSGGFTDLALSDQAYIDACVNAKMEGDSSFETPPKNLFNTKILTGIELMMKKIYTSLGALYALGQSLMCYATDIGYHCVGLKVFGVERCAIKLVNLTVWLCGVAIFLTAFFMSMSVGMYFIDVSFKIGFALLMLPISIALWPFEVTRGKLSENFSIIIRNAMLFALVSIGVSFAVILIEQGVLHGIDEEAFNAALKDENSRMMAEDYSLDSMRILVILFCLIFGLKIITSSVTDYLNKIFPDNLFGGSSPMHHMGTQAFGYVQSRTVTPAAALVGDMAKNGAGHLMMGVGSGLSKMSQGDFTPLKNIASFGKKAGNYVGHKVTHPREIVQGGVNILRRGAQATASGIAAVDREMTDVGRLIAPGIYSEEKRQAEKMEYDNNSQRREDKAREIIGAAADFTNAGIDVLGDGTQKLAAAGAAKVANSKVGKAAVAGAQALSHGAQAAAVGAAGLTVQGAQVAEEFAKDKITSGAAAVLNAVSDEKASTEDMRATLHDAKESTKETVKGWGKAAMAGMKDGAINYDKGSYSLSPGTILGNAAKIVTAPLRKETYQQLAKLPELYKKRMSTEGIREKQQAEDARKKDKEAADAQILPNSTKAQRIIMKSTRGVTRLFVRTGVDTAQTATAVTGSLLQKFGKKLTQNKPRDKGYWKQYWDAKDREERAQKLAEQEQRETDATLADQFEERR